MRLGIIAFSLLMLMLANCSAESQQNDLRELQIEQAKLEIELLYLELSVFRDQETVSTEK